MTIFKLTGFIGIIMLLVTCGGVYAEDPPAYFYQQHLDGAPEKNSCAEIFNTLLAGGAEDAGGIVRSLKSINVAYLLDDYDNSLSSDRRKKNYLNLDELRQEVAAGKQGIYCRIELAIYLRQHAEYAGPVYDMLLDEALGKLEETYRSAEKSFTEGDFARAQFAFDLIAPYRDAHDKAIAAAGKLAEESELIAKTADEQPDVDGLVLDAPAGPIARAAIPRSEERPVAVDDGPIARAARVGPVTAAVEAGK